MRMLPEVHELLRNAPPFDPVWTPNEVAARLRVSRRTVYRLIADGDLDSFKLRRGRRVRQSAVVAYLSKLDGRGQSVQADARPERQTDIGHLGHSRQRRSSTSLGVPDAQPS